MPETVWKYSVPIYGGTTKFNLHLPKGATPVHFASVESALWLWVKADPAKGTEWRNFGLYGTGVMILDAGVHVASAVIPEIGEVYHLFEET